MQVIAQALAAAQEELSPILAPLLPLLQAVHSAHHFPCCLGAVASAVEACGRLASCRDCLCAAVGGFVDALLQRLQVVIDESPQSSIVNFGCFWVFLPAGHLPGLPLRSCGRLRGRAAAAAAAEPP